jgi:hypothetical protein
MSEQGPRKDFMWGGCSDNIRFGFKFTKEFVDSNENNLAAPGLMNLWNNNAGRNVSYGKLDISKHIVICGLTISKTLATQNLLIEHLNPYTYTLCINYIYLEIHILRPFHIYTINVT